MKKMMIIPIDKEKLLRLYAEGMPAYQLGTVFDCDPGTIFNRLHAYGVKTRTSSESAKLASANRKRGYDWLEHWIQVMPEDPRWRRFVDEDSLHSS